MKLKRKQKSIGCNKCGRSSHSRKTCTLSSDVVEIHPSDYPCSLDSIIIEEISSYHNTEKLPVRIFRFFIFKVQLFNFFKYSTDTQII